MLIVLKPKDAVKYRNWLQSYEALFQKKPDASTRTECFLAIQNNTTPHWVRKAFDLANKMP